MSRQIPGAQLVELEGAHSPLTGETDTILDKVEEFVTGRRGERHPDRVLATVMFTDIVDSTVHAAALGGPSLERAARGPPPARARAAAALRRSGDKDDRRRLTRYLDGLARAIRCALATIEATQQTGLSLRVGLHTGECERRWRYPRHRRTSRGARRSGRGARLAHRERPRRWLRCSVRGPRHPHPKGGP